MVSRRRLLALAGAAATGVGSGCLDGVGGGPGEPTGSPETGRPTTDGIGPTDGTPPTTDAQTTLRVTSATFADVDAGQPVAVVSEPLGGLLRTAAASDGPATLVHALSAWESRPPALAALDAANLRFEGGSATAVGVPPAGAYSLALRWGPVYDHAFEVDAVAGSEVPADETPVAVADQPAAVREPLVDAIRSGTASLSPRSDAYFLVVSADEEATNETKPVAYLRYEGRYYAVVQRASTPVPTDELYLRLRASREGDVDDSLVTLSVPAVSDAVRGAFGRALGAWSAGENGYVVEGAGDALAAFDDRYDHVLTTAALFGFEVRG